MFFFFFHFFKILIFWVVSGVKGQIIMSHNDRKLICRAPYIRNHTSYQLWYTSVKWWHLQACCFHLVFQIFIFKVFREVKGQKMVQNDKKLWLSCWYLKNHTLWLWFMVHVCKMIISASRHFSHFPKFWLCWLSEVGGRAKNDPKSPDSVCHTLSQEL